MYHIFFHPNESESAAADFIPFCSDGVFHLFYLYDHRNPDKCGEGISWDKLTTKDLLHFTDHGTVLPHGEPDSPDLYAFTGSVIQAEDIYHIFYTGHNPHLHTYGDHLECIMHAVSKDLQNWFKISEDSFYSPEGYDKCDFRDPFVYYDAESQTYFMLLCARPEGGNRIRKGETMQMFSRDLKTWNFDRVLYAPQKFHTQECPDLFQIGEWWYLIFSEYTEKNTTCYRMSKHQNGPWEKPDCDTLDGRAYYAAKTASDGKNRFLFGWVPTRCENEDNKPWMWGGNLLIHQIVQNADGTLGTCLPESISKCFQTPILKEHMYKLDTPYSTQIITLLLQTPDTYKFSMSCEISSDRCDSFGILVKRNSDADASYGFTIDLSEKSVYINTFPCLPQNEFDTYQLRRPVIPGKHYDLELLADKDIFVLYVNKVEALSVRLCSPKGTEFAIYASHGSVQFSNIELFELSKDNL